MSDIDRSRPVNIICIPTPRRKFSHDQGIRTGPGYLTNSEPFLTALATIMGLRLWLLSLSFSCSSRHLHGGAGFGITGALGRGWRGQGERVPQTKGESVTVEAD